MMIGSAVVRGLPRPDVVSFRRTGVPSRIAVRIGAGGRTRTATASPSLALRHYASSSSAAVALRSGRTAALFASAAAGCVAGASAKLVQAEAAAAPGKIDEETRSVLDEVASWLGLGDAKDEDEAAADDGADDGESTEEGRGPGKPVKVPLDPELVSSLPLLPLSSVSKPTGELRGRTLVTHEGIVYDITEFLEQHPGGRDLVMTAAGCDLSHFFDNYTVHGQSDKAANWLASMAVGRLTPEDAVKAKEGIDASVHVRRRFGILAKARRRIIFVTASLPLWMTVRTCVRFVGWIVPGLGRLLARLVPVAVPGLSRGADPIAIEAGPAEAGEGAALPELDDASPRVAVIGGGIAGCGAAWALRRSGFSVTLYEARPSVSGNARTFDWTFPDGSVVKSCCSVTAWPPLFYKNYTALLEELGVETVHQPLSWFLNSKVPGAVGTLWGADPTPYEGSLRNVLKKDFDIYGKVVRFSDACCNLFTCRWAPWRKNDTPSMYDSHTGVGLLNPMNVVPLYSMFRAMGGSELWWQVVFTPYYTASFLVDELRPFPAGEFLVCW